MDLKEMERKIYMKYHEDGLVDIVIGLFIIALGLDFVPNVTVLAQVWLFPLLLVMWAAKKRITIPRLGYVRFSEQRQTQVRNNLVITAVVGIACLALVMGALLVLTNPPANVEGIIRSLGPIPFGVFLAVFLALIGFSIQLYRSYAYAGLVLATFTVARWFDDQLHWFVIAIGGTIVVIGVALLIRFLQTYPLTTEGVPDAKL